MTGSNSTREIPVDQISNLLSYDPETGLLTWKVKRGASRVGKVAGFHKCRGYIAVRVMGVIYHAHRVAWALYNNESPPTDREIDHIDGDKSNNRIANLRLATSRQNKYNVGISAQNTSGAKGVTYRKNRGKWQAQISVDNACVYLGSYNSFDDAVAARKAAEEKYCGEFIRNI